MPKPCVPRGVLCRQSGGFFMPPKRRSLKSRAEPPTGNAANRAKRKAADPKACRF
nr:MAG TPA: hypothetical protein [Caudoviricetes sp.]DAQ32877.1 MAG TPA: hypothetical protein [Caudoviricetes sp.]DAZ54363.1 MAG TPA: hypothetical protein [Caudoviricetes sp.]